MSEHSNIEQPAQLLTPDEIRGQIQHLYRHVGDALKITKGRGDLARCFVGNDAIIMASLLDKVAGLLGSAAGTLEAIDRLDLQVAREG
jgi:hypothetical protein